MHSAKKPGRAARTVGNVLAAVVLLGAPLGALAALQPWQAPSGVTAPAAADDAVANGLAIVERPAAGEAPRLRGIDQGPLETLVRDWTYTGRPSPSPGK